MASKLLMGFSFVAYVSSARILGISPTPSYSHQIVLQSIWQELSLRGHELIVLTADPIKNSSLTNLTEIDLHEVSYEIFNRKLSNIIDARKNSVLTNIFTSITTFFEIADAQFQNEQIRALINNDTERFDLVIVEYIFPIYYVFAAHFNCPFIGVTTMDPPPFTYNFAGNPNHPAITSETLFYYDEKLTIFQRVQSFFTTIPSGILFDILFRAQQQEIIYKHFKKEMPHVHEIARNVSLLFLNTEPILHRIRSLVPSVIQIGGKIYQNEGKPLAKDMKDILDKATDGFIYFSLGSIIKSKDLPTEKQKIILETFAELPFLVLWKFELEDLSNKPKNVITFQWLPQERVLKHSNIKLFITQGGLQSVEEAIFSFVPMVSMPIIGDQFQNVQNMITKGMDLSVDYKTLNKDDFKIINTMPSKLLIVLLLVTYVSSARILGMSPSASYSHQIVLQPIWQELSLRGHELVVLTTDPIKNSSLTNLTEINLHKISYDIWNRELTNIINARKSSIFKSLYIILTTLFEIADAQFQNEQVQAIINNDTEHFDLVIVEYLLPIYSVFSAHFDCPFIGITTMDPPPLAFNLAGNPNHPAITSDGQFYYDEKLTFFQRIRKMPHVHEIAKNVSLLFINTEPILHPIRSLVPSVIQIGGKIHKSEEKPLTKDLKDILDKAVDGFIYFSLGSNVKSKDLPASKQKILLETFAELPFLVLWKFEFDDLLNKPKNVITFKWLSQERVLKHPNIKLFITQGGLQSMEEAIVSFVPMIGMPFIGDQFQNVQNMINKGMGLSVDYKTLNKDDFKSKIIEVITNSKYKKKVIEIGGLIQDQPMTGLEKVVWWTEYVLRHKGAKHLRSPFLDVPIYQILLLDVLFVVVVFIILLMELSLRGHELVVVTADPIKNSSLTNLTEIDLHEISYDIWNRKLPDIINARQSSVLISAFIIITTLFEVADAQFQHEEIRMLINNETERFDLVIVEYLLPIYYVFPAHFDCPFIGVTSMDPTPLSFNFAGNPNHPAITSDGQFYYDEKLTFFQRIRSFFITIPSEFLFEIVFGAYQHKLISKYFNKKMPHVNEIARNVSLLFINTEPIFHPIRSLVPSVIQIGGKTHKREEKPLAKDLKNTLDINTNGFIYFSLGSNVKSKYLPAAKRKIILETLQAVPFLVLWKFELDDLPNKPKNVITCKWVSQESVLKHPNIKLFITQGGLQSMEEAIYSFVPMIGMPFMADQFQNVQKMEGKGMGLSVDYKTLNKDDFKSKIMEVITNPKYKKKVIEIGTLIQDQPMTGLEKVVWWTEYVLRHKGAKHLRSPFLDLPIYQLLLLDVLFVVTVFIISLIILIWTIFKCACRLISKSK
ncbi:hypothetical protein FQR65_LT02583 [Abscondita terminalis]|nr:hypothetical protein FQR65_LT02583 [Abscondita terminalis]